MNFYFLNLSYFDRLRDKDCIIQTVSLHVVNKGQTRIEFKLSLPKEI